MNTSRKFMRRGSAYFITWDPPTAAKTRIKPVAIHEQADFTKNSHFYTLLYSSYCSAYGDT